MFGAHTSYKERKIFVGNLSLYSDEEGLKNHFRQFGEVTDVNILKHPETQRSRRFGFVSFSANSSVEAALNADPSTQVLDNMKLGKSFVSSIICQLKASIYVVFIRLTDSDSSG